MDKVLKQLAELSGQVNAVERKLDALIAEIVASSHTPPPMQEEITCSFCRSAGRRVSNCPGCGGTGS